MRNEPLINILIRSHRPEKLRVALSSVNQQSHRNYRVHLFQTEGRIPGYSYNLFCNQLKDGLKNGWFFFLDDDDTLLDPSALSRIAPHLTDPDQAVICQFLRAGRPKPSDRLMDKKVVCRGMIGMPCIFLHSKHKNLAYFDDTEAADYNFIRDISKVLPLKFVKEVVVNSQKRSYGR